MNKEKPKKFFIVCPKCEGSGKGKMNFPCFNCGGTGTGRFWQNYFLYFDKTFTNSDIFWRRIMNKFLIIVDLLALILGFGGVASLAWWIWNHETQNIKEYFLFWQNHNLFILFFWIGILSFLFFYYKLERREEKKEKIKKIKDHSDSLPNNWAELKKYKKTVNVAETLNEEALKIIEEAFLLARKRNHQYTSTLHLFFVLFQSRDIKAMFIRLNVDAEKLFEKINHQLSQKKAGEQKEAIFSPAFKQSVVEAYIEAYGWRQNNLKALNLISYCVARDKILTEILWDLEVTLDKINNVKSWFKTEEKLKRNLKIFKKNARYKPKTAMNRAYTAMATPNLNRISYDLTLAAKWGRLDLCVSREKELNNILNILKTKNNTVILTGSPGVGKRTIIKGMATLMVEENVPEFLKDKRLLELDASRLISGADPSQAEERLLTILDEISRAGNIVLFIQNINLLIGVSSGGEGSMDLSEVLANALEKRVLYCLATVNNEKYDKDVENSHLGRVMSRVKIEEPKDNQVIRIIESKIGRLEYKYKVFFTYNALERAVKLSDRYIHDKFLPEKALDILEKTAMRVSQKTDKKEIGNCNKREVSLTVKKITQIPVEEVNEKEGEKLINLEKEIHKFMINQDEAVDMVANSLRRARANLRESKKTIANFLFLGPTGVGKTELAKTVARVYFGKKEYLIRLDMSEYQHEDSVSKMIGDGQKKGYLTEAVRKNPFSLILLDEFEKAHSKIFNLFLQVMDDGRLTDGGGKTIDFTNSVLIATSNIASNFIKKQVTAGKPLKEIKEEVINNQLSQEMKPELINRFDGIIIFKPLSIKNVAEITKLILSKTSQMLEEKGIFFEASPEGIKKLAQEGYDPAFGARPLKRLLQEKIDNEIAKKILAGDIKRRDKIIINQEGKVVVAKSEEL